MEIQSFQIANISCGHCVAAIQRELAELAGVVKVDGDPSAKSVTVHWQAPVTEAHIKAKLSKIGYPAGRRDTMTMDAEKRKENRLKCGCNARYSVFNQSAFYDSRIVDFSDSGMQLKSSIPATVGTTVMVQVTQQPADVQVRSGFICPTNRSIGIGEVRWCERLDNGEGSGRYLLGVKLHSF